jgi:hypothetical protein
MGSTTKHKSVKRKPPMCLPSSSMAAVSGVRDVGKKVVIQELEGGGGRIAVPAAGGDASGSCSETEPRRCGASDEGSDYDSESPNHAAFQGTKVCDDLGFQGFHYCIQNKRLLW